MLEKFFRYKIFVNKLKSNNSSFDRKEKNKNTHPNYISILMNKKEKKFYVHLGKIIMILAKMIVHFSICFSVQFSLVRLITFDSSLVLILSLFVSWVNRCRLFRCFRVFHQVRQRGQWSFSRLPSCHRRTLEVRRRWNHLLPFQSRRQRESAYTMH